MTSAPPRLSPWRRMLVAVVALVIGVVVADVAVAGPTHASASDFVAASAEVGHADAATSSLAVYVYDGPNHSAPDSVSVHARGAAHQGVRGLGDRGHDRSHWYDHRSQPARAHARSDGYGSAPNTASRYVIGGMEDLGAGSLRAGEATVASRLPANAGNRLGNWLNNRDVLRSIMREGRPIRDASVDSAGNLLYQDTRRFITLERDFLRSHRWTYDPSSNLWIPPG